MTIERESINAGDAADRLLQLGCDFVTVIDVRD